MYLPRKELNVAWFLEQWTCMLDAYGKGCTNVFHSFDVRRRIDEGARGGIANVLGLAVRFWMIRFCCQIFNTEESAYCSEEFPDEFSTIVSKEVRRHAESYEPMIKVDNHNVRGCYLGRWNMSTQIRVSVTNDK